MPNKSELIKSAKVTVAKSRAGWAGLYVLGEDTDGSPWLLLCADKKDASAKLRKALKGLQKDVTLSKKSAGVLTEGKTLSPKAIPGVAKPNPGVAAQLFKKLKQDRDWKKIVSKLAFGSDEETIQADEGPMSDEEMVSTLREAAGLNDKEAAELLQSSEKISGLLDTLPNLEALLQEVSELKFTEDEDEAPKEMSKEERQQHASEVISSLDPSKILFADSSWMMVLHDQLAVDLSGSERGVLREGTQSHGVTRIRLPLVEQAINEKNEQIANELLELFENSDDLYLPGDQRTEELPETLSAGAAAFLRGMDTRVDSKQSSELKTRNKKAKRARLKVDVPKHTKRLLFAYRSDYLHAHLAGSVESQISGADTMSDSDLAQAMSTVDAFSESAVRDLLKAASLAAVKAAKEALVGSLGDGTVEESIGDGDMGIQIGHFGDYYTEVIAKTEQDMLPTVLPTMMDELSQGIGEDIKETGELTGPFTKEKIMPVALKAARHHCTLAWIHPYPDGNGRMSRAIVDVMLKAAGLPAVTLLSDEAYNKAAGEGVTKKNYQPLADIITDKVLKLV